MAIPLNRLSTRVVFGTFIEPYDRNRPTLTEDYSRGGIALNDTSEGLNYQNWTLRLVGDEFIVTAETTEVDTVVLSGLNNVSECSLAFDQNMNVFIAYVEDGQPRYYWFDPTILDYAVQDLPEGVQTPQCRIDDVRDTQTDNSRIILAYVRAGTLYFRDQADRYTVEYALTPVTSLLEKFGMGENGRLQFQLVDQNDGQQPIIVQQPEIVIPYWTNPDGGRIDFTQTRERSWQEVFGTTIADDAEINQLLPVSENSGTLPWRIPFRTTDGGNRIRIRADSTMTNAFIAICSDDGSVIARYSWTTGDFDTPDIAIPVNVNGHLILASETDSAFIRKVDISPDSVDDPDLPPGSDPLPPTDTTGAFSWEAFFGVPSPYNGGPASIGNVFKWIPEAGASIWFTVPDNVPAMTVAFRLISTPGSGRGAPNTSLNTTVGDFRGNGAFFAGTPPTRVFGSTPGSGFVPQADTQFARFELKLEPGRTYIWNAKINAPELTGQDRYIIFNYVTTFYDENGDPI